MSDLVAARYPLAFDEWAFDGYPAPPARQSISRRDITSGTAGFSPNNNAVTNSSGIMYVVGVPCSQGDVIGAISVWVAVAASGPTHAWMALYTGMAAASTLIGQSTDTTSTAIAAGQLKVTLTTPYVVGGGPAGVAQGATATAASGPAVLGVALFFTASTSIPTIDAATGGTSPALSLNGTTQTLIVGKAGSSLTGTAPSTLTGIATPTPGSGAAGIPYVVLSRS